MTTAVASSAELSSPESPGRARLVRVVLSPEVLAVVGFVALWQFVSIVFNVSFIPSAFEILGRVVELVTDGGVVADIMRSLRNLLIGYVVAVVIGVPAGMLMARFKAVKYALSPYVNALLVAPTLVFAPIFFVIFGLSPTAVVGVVIMYCVFLIILSTQRALEGVDRSLVDMSRTFGSSELQTFRHVLLPASSPLIFAALRIGLGRAVKGMLNGEMFIAAVGLGARTMQFGANFDATGVLAIMVIVVIIAMTTGAGIQTVERRMTRWTEIRR